MTVEKVVGRRLDRSRPPRKTEHALFTHSASQVIFGRLQFTTCGVLIHRAFVSMFMTSSVNMCRLYETTTCL